MVIFIAEHMRRKRGLKVTRDSEEGRSKKVKVDDPRGDIPLGQETDNGQSRVKLREEDTLVTSASDTLPPESTEEKDLIKWNVVNIRLRSKSNTNKDMADDSDHAEAETESDRLHTCSTKYGYVEFSERRMVLDVLKCFDAHKELFVGVTQHKVKMTKHNKLCWRR